MPPTAFEKPGLEFEEGENPTLVATYVVVDAADETEANAAIAEKAPQERNGISRVAVGSRNLVRNIWLGEARWGVTTGGAPVTGATIFGFDTTGGRIKKFTSLGSDYFPAPGKATIDFKHAINVTDDGVEGIDIVVPQFACTVTKWFANSYVTQSWIDAIELLTGRINNAALLGWPRPLGGRAAGEALFLGARGQQRGVNGDFELTFEFAVSHHRHGSDMVSEIAPFDPFMKDGHSLLWIKYEDAIDDGGEGGGGGSKLLIKRPRQANVESVYKFGDFSLLGIGSA